MHRDWVNAVWQTDKGRRFESAEQAQMIMSLIMHMHNDIVDALQVGEAFGPLMPANTLESGEPIVVAQGWCWDFMAGMRTQFEGWEAHLDMLNERVVPSAVLAPLGDDDPELQEPQELLDDQQKIAQLNDGTPESAAAIDAYSRSIADGP
jgi:yecA family protein